MMIRDANWAHRRKLSRILMVWMLLVLMSACAVAQDAVTQWMNQDGPWIRVGLKKPVETPKFRAYGPLWILDGKKPVAQIDPQKAFWVVRSKHAGSSFWVQVQASANPEVLERTRRAISKKTSAESFRIVSRAKSRLKVLQFGPYFSKESANGFRSEVVGLGLTDAFLVRNKDSYPYFWVDDNFDKHVIPAAHPGMVSANPDTQITFNGSEYRGILYFKNAGKQIRVVNQLPLETYLRGVVPAEMGPHAFPEIEALKAQAIAARTYALKNMGRFERNGFDICDSPSCQVYEGFGVEHPMSDEAISSTQGLVLTHQGELIDALYTSTCGGHTEDVSHVFPGRFEAYLKGKSSYVSGIRSWKLPRRPVPKIENQGRDEELLVQAMLYGFEAFPKLDGALEAVELKQWMHWLSWVWGTSSGELSGKTLKWEKFYASLAGYPVLSRAIEHQMAPLDIVRLTRDLDVSPNLAPLTALLHRFDLLAPEVLDTVRRDAMVDKRSALRVLMHLTQGLGPVLTWKTYKLENVDDQTLVLSRGSKEHRLDLDTIKNYLVERGDALTMVPEVMVEELDFIEIPNAPCNAPVIKVVQRGKVASIDRFSKYGSWIEKRSIDEINSRARQYIPGISEIREIKVLERSSTGRVTLLEFVARSGKHRVDGLRIRWSLGIRDNLFDMIPFYRDGKLMGATFLGRGWGHGVGMSQVGAYGLARVGWSYQKILEFYYSDVTIEPFN